MSLLLDALKRAEQAKQGSSLSLEPIDDNTPAPNAPSKPSYPGVTPGRALGNTDRRVEQDAARAAFTAKQPQTQSRPLWLLVGGLSLLAVAAGAFWLWYVLSYPSPVAPVRQTNVVSQPAAVPPPRVESPVTPPPVAPNGKIETAPSSVVKPETPAAPSVSRSPAKASSQKTTRPSANEPPVKRSSAEAPAVSPALNSAYVALTQGDYTVAKHQYQIVLLDDPLNLDANLGLATVAASTGDLSAAQRYYRAALEIDPKNSVAHAGLAAVQMNQNAQGSESQLKAQIAREPQQAPTYSTLGHVYVTQGKWGEAQQAFFEAYRLDPTNPDHAFNLAVSLDRLGQRKLAREYYGKALSLAASRPSGFSTAEAANRMNQLGTANE